jgi:hypothetical protein
VIHQDAVRAARQQGRTDGATAQEAVHKINEL